MRYAATKGATQYDLIGRLKCDRCGHVVDPWPLRRPDNCGPGAHTCIREVAPVLAGWARERAKRGAVQPVTRVDQFTLPASEFVVGSLQVLDRSQHVVSEGR